MQRESGVASLSRVLGVLGVLGEKPAKRAKQTAKRGPRRDSFQCPPGAREAQVHGEGQGQVGWQGARGRIQKSLVGLASTPPELWAVPDPTHL